MKYVMLATAIVAEVIATTAMKQSEGFSLLPWTILTVVGCAVAFYFPFADPEINPDRRRLCDLVRRRHRADFSSRVGGPGSKT